MRRPVIVRGTLFVPSLDGLVVIEILRAFESAAAAIEASGRVFLTPPEDVNLGDVTRALMDNIQSAYDSPPMYDGSRPAIWVDADENSLEYTTSSGFKFGWRFLQSDGDCPAGWEITIEGGTYKGSLLHTLSTLSFNVEMEVDDWGDRSVVQRIREVLDYEPEPDSRELASDEFSEEIAKKIRGIITKHQNDNGLM